MKYFGGCDVGSTYAKCVILDENGKIIADATVRSKINPVKSAELALGEAISKVPELSSPENLTYLIGTGYGVLEPGGVGGVAGDGHIHLSLIHI